MKLLAKCMESFMEVGELVAFDFETNGLEYYRHDFQVLSAAFSWLNRGEVRSLFVQGETEVGEMLRHLSSLNAKMCCHNAQFEYGVTKYRFPDIALNWHADTMRLVQVYDNGGKKAQAMQYEKTLDELLELEAEDDEKEVRIPTGLGLQASAARILPPEYHNHKEPYHSYLRETHGIKKGKEGTALHLLPPEMLEAYNVADTSVTLALYTTITDHFRKINYDWRLDHQLYMSSAKMIAESKGNGILVDCEALRANIIEAEAEIGKIWAGFQDRFRAELDALEQRNLERIVSKRTSESGQAKAWLMAIERNTYKFNLNSTKQKTELFMGLLGIEPVFRNKITKKMEAKGITEGSPAFGKAFLGQWGEGGFMLKSRGTLLIGLKQMQNLLQLAEYDGKWHVDLRAAGTTTGRAKGGS